MIDNLFKIINILLAQIAFDNILTRLACVDIFIAVLIGFYLITLQKTALQLKDFKIVALYDMIPFIVVFFVGYLGILLYFKYCNFGKALDLKECYHIVKYFLVHSTYSYFFITIYFYVLLFVIICLLLLLTKTIKLNIYKIILYLTSKQSLNILEETPYRTFRDAFFNFYCYVTMIFYKIFVFFKKKVKKHKQDKFQMSRIEMFLVQYRNYNALIILLLLLLYDSFFNNFVLTKIYYFLPIVFLYNVMIFITKIITLNDTAIECDIACYLYMKPVLEYNDLIGFENNFVISKKDLKIYEETLNMLKLYTIKSFNISYPRKDLKDRNLYSKTVV